MERRVSRSVALPALLAALLVVVVVSAGQGPVAITYPAVAAILGDAALSTLWETIVGNSPPIALFEGPSDHATIVRDIRSPRIAVAATVGFALAAAGTVMQGFFRNPMADPAIIGVSSGAALGAVSVIVFSIAVPYGITAAAFAGAIVAAFAVYGIATTNGRTGVARLLLAGVAMQTFLGALTSLALYLGDDAALRSAVFWMMGDLGGKSWGDVVMVTGPTVVGFGVLMAHARELDMLLLGEAEASGLGVAVERTKRILLAVASVVTASAVAVAGVIGFVGLIVPHAVRLVVGPEHRALLPASAVAGAVFLVAADTVARTVLGGGQLPIGIVTALVGVPFFLHLLRQREVYEL